MKEKAQLPDGIDVEYKDGVLRVTGDGEEVEKVLEHPKIQVEINDDEVVFSTDSTKRDVTSILGTFRSHTENMVEGVQEPHVYTMKGVYAHFPMTIKQESGKVLIENFMGERAPREIDIMDGVDVQIDGDDLKLTGANKDSVAQTAARIEQACKKGDRDPRTFQDGVYIVKGDRSE
ncbi:MAG: 50S ribosomal protein L6 [Candidatus Nanohaloarchaea archaeon]